MLAIGSKIRSSYITMSKLDDCIEKYTEQLKGVGVKVDADLLRAVAKGIGPANYNNDAAKIAASDKKELETIKQKFLIKKLGLADTPKLDEGIQACIDKIGRSNRSKWRGAFYYILVKHFRKSKVYA